MVNENNDDENKDEKDRNYEGHALYEGDDMKKLWRLWHELSEGHDKLEDKMDFWLLWNFTKIIIEQYDDLTLKIRDLRDMLEERDLELFYNNWYEFNPDWIEEMS